MVKQVLHWRATNPEVANPLWNELQSLNEGFAAELTRLANVGINNVEDADKFAKLRDTILAIRERIRKMSELSKVPIEPPQQTALLDAICKVPDVIGGVVPGAGGYDAVVVLIKDKEEVLTDLKQLLSAWKVDEQADGSDGVKIGKVGMLAVREDASGVRPEDPSNYKEWV